MPWTDLDRVALVITTAFAEAARAEAFREAAARCEQQRQKILANKDDPSWTEHLAECGSDFENRANRGL